MMGSISLFGGLEPRRTYGSSDSFTERKQASRTPNASRIMTARSMSEPQCLKEQPNLAAAFGVREACFRCGVSGGQRCSLRGCIPATQKVRCFHDRTSGNQCLRSQDQVGNFSCMNFARLLPVVLLAATTLLRQLQAGESTALPYDQKTDIVFGEVSGTGLLMDVFTPRGQGNGL